MIEGSGRITLRQLRYFDAVARHLHFGRAAGECAVSQPSLSVQIQDLEQAVGVALIERSRMGIKLTADGEDVARRAKRILSEVKDLADSTPPPRPGAVGLAAFRHHPDSGALPVASALAASAGNVHRFEAACARDADRDADDGARRRQTRRRACGASDSCARHRGAAPVRRPFPSGRSARLQDRA